MLRRQESKRQRRAAFTLMEMLIVVAIIVMLAGIGVVSYLSLFAGSQKDVAKTQVKSLGVVCDTYKLKNGANPESLAVLLQKDPMGVIYVEDPDKLLDPWKKPYQYDASGQKNQGLHADIWTVSPDGIEIGNWPKQAGR
ncbi:MAG: prepilin-type N-terminal cleavage/methylation domain-containing protein [Gemmataceae bacterium]|nr:prepilin-type N-terminal cleavage/methylation domain-containing protein [Gemmataceae bacterium]